MSNAWRMDGPQEAQQMDNSSGVVPCEIEGQTSNNHQVVLPLGLTPRDGGHQDTFTTLASTKTWFMENKGKVEELLELHGAVVFRGFPLRTPEDFDEVVSGGLGVQVFPYQAGNAPRHKVVGNVYTSTELPPMFPLIPHHEMCYRTSFPGKLFFFCETPAQADGETPLCDSHEIYNHLLLHRRHFLDKVATHGARYHKIFHDETVVGFPPTSTSWQAAYSTSDPRAVEEATRALGSTWTWHPHNNSFERITAPIPAIRQHPKSHKKVWFNNIHFSHPASWNTTKEHLTSYVTFGNGEEVDPEDAKYVTNLIWKNCVMLKWQAGDMVAVDNVAVLHGRSKYSPPRKVYLIMAH